MFLIFLISNQWKLTWNLIWFFFWNKNLVLTRLVVFLKLRNDIIIISIQCVYLSWNHLENLLFLFVWNKYILHKSQNEVDIILLQSFVMFVIKFKFTSRLKYLHFWDRKCIEKLIRTGKYIQIVSVWYFRYKNAVEFSFHSKFLHWGLRALL